MKYFTLATVGLGLAALSQPASATCGKNDMQCFCGENYSKWFDGTTWNDNRCKRGHATDWWPLEEGTGARCYNLYFNDYDYPMRINPKDPYVDQIPAFYYEDYPLTSQMGAFYSVYWDHPRALGIPCGFNLRNLARDMGKATKDTLRDGKAYIRALDMRSPLISYYPVTMFKNTFIAEMRLWLKAFRVNEVDLPTNFLDEEAKSHLINFNVRESFITSEMLDKVDFFSEYENLRDVSLKMNDLTYFNPDWFKNNDIHSLNLSHNELSSLPDDAFKYLSKLELLTLNYNQLTTLATPAWNDTPDLSVIYASFNQISSVPPGTLSSLKKLNRAWLYGNSCTPDEDNCKNGLRGSPFDNVDFNTKRAEFIAWISNQPGYSNAPGVKAQTETYWSSESGHWSRTSLMWARNKIPELTDERIEYFYDSQDTSVGANCQCS